MSDHTRPVRKLCAALTRWKSRFGSIVTIRICRPGCVVPLSIELNLDLDGLKPKYAAAHIPGAVWFAKETTCQSAPVKRPNTGTTSTPHPTVSRKRHHST